MILSDSVEEYQRIPQYQCAECKAHIVSYEQLNVRKLRFKIKIHIARLIIYLRFKEILPIRSISRIIEMAFGCRNSIGYVWGVCNQVGEKAKEKLGFLSKVKQKVGRVLIVDETFPKVKGRKGKRRF